MWKPLTLAACIFQVGRFLERETLDIQYTMEALSQEASPYKDR